MEAKHMNLLELARIRSTRKTGRYSSYDTTGRNADYHLIPAGQRHVLADITGPGIITHIWMTQSCHYRECLIGVRWDDNPFYSILCPLGDFFGLGHGMVNSYQSLLFTASTNNPYSFNSGCALNCYVIMPFKKKATIELVNESKEDHVQYFYIDYETVALKEIQEMGYFHAEFRRANPFGGWGEEIIVNTPPANIINKERLAWRNNYVILETKGCGHYIGCNLSISNFQGTWWGEGDDMIWVDGYKWPPDLHGTGSEDYFNQAWGMQPNAFLRNGSSIFEGRTLREKSVSLYTGEEGGYQTSYVFHIENPVRFKREIKVTIEHGHGNHLANDVCSTAYWYASLPVEAIDPPPVDKRMPVLKDGDRWNRNKKNEWAGNKIQLNEEMSANKQLWEKENTLRKTGRISERHSPFVTEWLISKLLPPIEIENAKPVTLKDSAGWKRYRAVLKRNCPQTYFVNIHQLFGEQDGMVYIGRQFNVKEKGKWILHIGHDGGVRVFVDGKVVINEPKRINPAPYERSKAVVEMDKGKHELIIAFDTDEGKGWGFYCSFEIVEAGKGKGKYLFPV